MTDKLIILKNTTGGNIEFKRAGITLIAGTSRDVSIVVPERFRTDATLITAIGAGDVVVNNGVRDMDVIEGEAYISNDITEDIITAGVGAITIPVGDTSERPSSPLNGMVRVNTDLGSLSASAGEIYDGVDWLPIFGFTTFTADSGPDIVADDPDDTLNITGGTGISTVASADTITINATGAGAIVGLTEDTIIGADTVASGEILFLEDTTRSNKDLTVSTQVFTWGTDDASQDKWIVPHDATDANAGYIMPYDGTIIWATVHTVDNKGTTTNWSLYINSTENTAVLTTTGSGQQQDEATDVDLDFSAGDKIRWRSRDDDAEDSAIAVGVKWRLP